MTKLTHRPVTLRNAQAFVAAHHRHNKAPRGARFALEAVFGGEVVGVVIVGRPVARMLDDGLTAEVVRCCVKDGAARRVWQTWGGQKVITYTLVTEPGDSLRGAGFVAVAKSRPSPKGWGRKNRARQISKTDGIAKVRWQAEIQH